MRFLSKRKEGRKEGNIDYNSNSKVASNITPQREPLLCVIFQTFLLRMCRCTYIFKIIKASKLCVYAVCTLLFF